VEEKLALLGPDTVTTGVSPCSCMDGGVERLGVGHYMNLGESKKK